MLDVILDVILKDDLNVCVVCEIIVIIGMVLIVGEIFIIIYVDILKVVREIIKEIGYIRVKYGYDYEIMVILIVIDE